ncbi:hypothetical protein NUSPORA_00722 [Nucleospora cyclopteri]
MSFAITQIRPPTKIIDVLALSFENQAVFATTVGTAINFYNLDLKLIHSYETEYTEKLLQLDNTAFLEVGDEEIALVNVFMKNDQLEIKRKNVECSISAIKNRIQFPIEMNIQGVILTNSAFIIVKYANEAVNLSFYDDFNYFWIIDAFYTKNDTVAIFMKSFSEFHTLLLDCNQETLRSNHIKTENIEEYKKLTGRIQVVNDRPNAFYYKNFIFYFTDGYLIFDQEGVEKVLTMQEMDQISCTCPIKSDKDESMLLIFGKNGAVYLISNDTKITFLGKIDSPIYKAIYINNLIFCLCEEKCVIYELNLIVGEIKMLRETNYYANINAVKPMGVSKACFISQQRRFLITNTIKMDGNSIIYCYKDHLLAIKSDLKSVSTVINYKETQFILNELITECLETSEEYNLRSASSIYVIKKETGKISKISTFHQIFLSKIGPAIFSDNFVALFTKNTIKVIYDKIEFLWETDNELHIKLNNGSKFLGIKREDEKIIAIRNSKEIEFATTKLLEDGEIIKNVFYKSEITKSNISEKINFKFDQIVPKKSEDLIPFKTGVFSTETFEFCDLESFVLNCLDSEFFVFINTINYCYVFDKVNKEFFELQNGLLFVFPYQSQFYYYFNNEFQKLPNLFELKNSETVGPLNTEGRADTIIYFTDNFSVYESVDDFKEYSTLCLCAKTHEKNFEEGKKIKLNSEIFSTFLDSVELDGTLSCFNSVCPQRISLAVTNVKRHKSYFIVFEILQGKFKKCIELIFDQFIYASAIFDHKNEKFAVCAFDSHLKVFQIFKDFSVHKNTVFYDPCSPFSLLISETDCYITTADYSTVIVRNIFYQPQKDLFDFDQINSKINFISPEKNTVENFYNQFLKNVQNNQNCRSFYTCDDFKTLPNVQVCNKKHQNYLKITNYPTVEVKYHEEFRIYTTLGSKIVVYFEDTLQFLESNEKIQFGSEIQTIVVFNCNLLVFTEEGAVFLVS